MNTLVYVEPSAEAQLLLRSLERLELGALEYVARWDQLLARLAASRPDVAVVSYASMADGGAHRLETAALTLKAIGVPVVVSLDSTYSAVAADIETQTGFSHFVSAPFEGAALGSALSAATGMGGFTRRSTSVTNDFAAVVDGDSAPHEAVPEDAEAAAEASGLETPPAESDDASSITAGPAASGAADALAASDALASSMSGSTRLSSSGAVFAPPFDPSLSGDHDGLSSSGDHDALSSLSSSGDHDALASSGGHDALASSGGHDALASSGGHDALASSGDQRVTAVSPPFLDDADAGATVEVSEIHDEARFAAFDDDDDEPAPPSFADSLAQSDAVASSGSEVHDDAPLNAEDASEEVEDASATPPSGEAASRVIALPPDEGEVSEHDVAVLMHGLHVRRATGELLLKNATLVRRVVVFDGEFGTVFQAPSADDERKLLSAFGWNEGTYAFSEQDVPEAQFHSFGAPLELIFRGVERHVGINELAVALGDELRKYPRRTDQIHRVAQVLGLEEVQTFADSATGDETLESMLTRSGARTEQTLRHAFFGRIVGAVVYDDAPSTEAVSVSFDAPAGASAARPRIRATAASTPVGATPRVDSGSSDVAAQSGAEHRETYEMLGKRWSAISSQDGYETFGLDAGCGVAAVNERFYELVREYHPDRYARVQNQQIKTLAEKIFLHVRSIHTDLVAREQSGDFRRSSGDHSRRTSGVSVPGAASRGPRANSGSPPPVSAPSAGVKVPADAMSESGISSRERRARRRSTGSRLTSTGAHSAVRSTVRRRAVTPRVEGGPRAELSGGEQALNPDDSLNRLRSRAETSGGFTRGTTGSYPTVSSARRLAPEQLLRNAKKAVANGAEAKAYDLVVIAKQKGASGPEYDGMEWYLRARLGEISSAEATEKLGELFKETESKVIMAQLKLLAGHLFRLDERYRKAEAQYADAVKLGDDASEAERWLRFVKKRADVEPEEGAADAEPKSFLEKLKSIEIKFGKK